jgi:hypothetical protein
VPDQAASARTLRASAALSFAYFTAIGGFNPFAPLWYKELGMPVFVIGILVSLQSWTRLFAPYAWGALSAGKRMKGQSAPETVAGAPAGGEQGRMPGVTALAGAASSEAATASSAETPLAGSGAP